MLISVEPSILSGHPVQWNAPTISIIFMFSHLAISVTSGVPLLQINNGREPAKSVRLPANVNTGSQHDPTTLIVTNDNTRRPSPAVTTRDGQRDVQSTSSRSTSPNINGNNSNNKRQGKKLSPIDAANLFREQASNYPEYDINLLLKQTPDTIKDLYNVHNTQLDPRMNLTYRSNYFNNEDEEGQGVREESVCLTKTRNIYPREANRQNSLVYIPNNQEFMQVIQAEICQHPDRECSYLSDSLPYGMTSVCYQKYAYKKLLYMDPLEKRMASDLFRYPSCCSCYIRSLPFDLRSSTNGTRSVGAKPTLPINGLAGNNDQATGSVSQYLGEGPSEASSTNQTTDRSQNLTMLSRETSQPDASNQYTRPFNQTLVLTDDKVYSP